MYSYILQALLRGVQGFFTGKQPFILFNLHYLNFSIEFTLLPIVWFIQIFQSAGTSGSVEPHSVTSFMGYNQLCHSLDTPHSNEYHPPALRGWRRGSLLTAYRGRCGNALGLSFFFCNVKYSWLCMIDQRGLLGQRSSRSRGMVVRRYPMWRLSLEMPDNLGGEPTRLYSNPSTRTTQY